MSNWQHDGERRTADGGYEPRQWRDELDEHIAESMKDPEYAAAYAEAEARHARLLERPCSAGNCVELYDPATGESDTGWGPVGCPCQREGMGPVEALRAWLRDWWLTIRYGSRLTRQGRALRRSMRSGPEDFVEVERP